ncbi:hypothetical protein [Mesoterricola silvestris]|uniref:hypothetical protein n=1 Tax=Mesoterricola silvestris TaxID=2927979 RepID=UPI00292D9BE0|nr:hypothetical protein [Mesoterricola silvestris]
MALVQARAPGSQEALRAALRDLPESQVLALRAQVRGGGPEPAAQEATARVLTGLAKRADLPQGMLDAVSQALRGPGRAPESPAAAPEAWESWIKESVRALSDPSISPREAPFHAAQAREGTAFYELPLPWAAQAPLQMWVESDGGGKGRGNPESASTRVLLGLNFSRLGETRLGVAKGAGGLRVRVWAQHPEALVAAQAGMEEELRALGMPVDLRIQGLGPGPVPTIRSLAAGSSLQVLG